MFECKKYSHIFGNFARDMQNPSNPGYIILGRSWDGKLGTCSEVSEGQELNLFEHSF